MIYDTLYASKITSLIFSVNNAGNVTITRDFVEKCYSKSLTEAEATLAYFQENSPKVNVAKWDDKTKIFAASNLFSVLENDDRNFLISDSNHLVRAAAQNSKNLIA